jgi:nucleotide-binding universal stress UspA family protein
VKIVIGYDGSDCAAGAIADLRHAGLFGDTEAIVLGAADVFLPGGPEPGAEELTTSHCVAEAVARARARAEQAVAEARDSAEQGAGKVRGMFPSWKVTAEAVADAPYWAFIQRAEESRADLIVVGSHGRSALGRALLGSVSQHVLHNATCSVRVGRCANVSDAADRPVRVVLGIDGSPDSATAASAVAARQWPAGSEVRVVGVVDLRMSTMVPGLGPAAGWAMPAPPMEPTAEDLDSHLRRALENVAAEVRRPGLTVTTTLLDGDPKRVLVEEAHAWNADCIFLGAKGHTRIQRMLIGSVSAAVAARAHCSVEVVRSG